MLAFSNLWTPPRLGKFREHYSTIEVAIFVRIKAELTARWIFVVLGHG